tara:strand:- start:1150 stop:1440 length:291 start_codon:yes stop_codon:yes gene_type:complete
MIYRKIMELAEDVEPKEGQWKPTYEALEKFTDAVLALIPEEIWETRKCGICSGNGFVQLHSTNEVDYGRTWVEDCSCVVEYEAQVQKEYLEAMANG